MDFEALLADAAKVGISPLSFWDMTPRETVVAFDAAAWRAEKEQRRTLSLAWHVAALQRVKRLPSLAQLLRPRQPAREVPIEERRREFVELKAAWERQRR